MSRIYNGMKRLLFRDGWSGRRRVRTPKDYVKGEMEHEVINVMTSCSDNNAEIVQVLICSLSESHKNYRINFWFFHASVSRNKIIMLDSYCRTLPNVDFFEVMVEDVLHFEEMKRIGGKPDCERFLWFGAHEYLPEDIERVLYLDALDTVVVGDLNELYSCDFKNKYILACREINQYSRFPQLLVGAAREFYEATNDKDTVVRISYGIFNSGSIVLNLKKFRSEAPSLAHYCEVAKWAKSLLGTTFGDQGLFSLVHGSNFILIDDKFNYRFFVSRNSEYTVESPAVIHFCGFSPKPFQVYLSEEQEEFVVRHIESDEGRPFMIDGYLRMDVHYVEHYRIWWDYCMRTNIYNNIVGRAANNTLKKIINPMKEARV